MQDLIWSKPLFLRALFCQSRRNHLLIQAACDRVQDALISLGLGPTVSSTSWSLLESGERCICGKRDAALEKRDVSEATQNFVELLLIGNLVPCRYGASQPGVDNYMGEVSAVLSCWWKLSSD